MAPAGAQNSAGGFVLPHVMRFSDSLAFLAWKRKRRLRVATLPRAVSVGWWRGMGPRRKKMLKEWTR